MAIRAAAALATCLSLGLALGPALAEDGVLAELPFLDEVDEGHIGVDLSSSPERPFELWLDTGAQHSVLSPGYAREIGVSVRAARDRPYRRDTVLGRSLEFYIETSSSDTGARTFEYGLVGGNFLREYVVEVDYEKRVVRFLDAREHRVSEETAGPGELVLPMRLTNLRPAIEIALGNGSAWFLMDTGAPMDLEVSEERARALGIEVDPSAPRRRQMNVHGTSQSAVQRLPTARVGTLELRDLELEIALREGASYRATNIAGVDQALLGNDFLRRFRVRFDYPSRKVGLLPVALDRKRTTVTGTASAMPEADATPLRAAVPVGEQVFLEVDAPGDGDARAGPVGWSEVRGWAGSQRNREFDIAVVVDASGSTAYASGVDVDGDGKLGKARKRRESWRRFNPRHLCSDPGDTILDAELVATRRLFDVLDPARTRMALVTFSDRASLHAPLGSDRERLDDLLERLEFGSGATNFAHATATATETLLAGSEGEAEPPQRVILFLSDGYPTTPGSPKNAAKEALAAAEEAAAQGVVIHTFALFDSDDSGPDVFVAMAELTGGSHVRLDRPGDVVNELPRIDLAKVASLEIENATTGASGRATRVFPDGSFDGFVPLEPGENVVRVTARGEKGGARSVERTIVWDAREPADEAEAQAFAAELERFRKDLEARTEETALALESRRARERPEPQGKDVDLEIDAEDVP